MKATLAPVIIVFAAGSLAAVSTAHAQDARWTPWTGCWALAAENVRAAPAGSPDTSRARRSSPSPEAPRVCVEASGETATLRTTVAGKEALEQTIVANGSEQPISDGDCRGTQRAAWSKSGRLLFARAELTCPTEPVRRVSGMSLITAGGTWLDIRAVRVGDGPETTRVARYRREPGAPAAPGVRLSLADITEAVDQVSPRVLEAALVESDASFALSSRDLIDLDDAGVPDSVTDLLVALSYPERFVVERSGGGQPLIGTLSNDPLFMPWTLGSSAFGFGSFYDDYFFPAYYFPAYYYSPFAYSYSGRAFDPFGFGYFGPGYITIVPGVGGGGVPDEVQPSGQGRVVNGLGYTRVRPRETEPQQAAGTQGASGRRSPGITSDAGSRGGSSSGSSGGGSVSGQGFSSGSSSGGGGGRTAVPR